MLTTAALPKGTVEETGDKETRNSRSINKQVHHKPRHQLKTWGNTSAVVKEMDRV